MFSSSLLAVNSFRNLKFISSREDINLWDELGQPVDPVQAAITVASTSTIRNFDFGNLNPLSLILMVVEGYIVGAGGNGGQGSLADLPGSFGGFMGSAGSVALNITCTLHLNMMLGRIWGGGGGGGGSGAKNAANTGGDGGGGGVLGDGLNIGKGGPAGTPGGLIGGFATPGISGIPGSGTQGGDGGDWGQGGFAGQTNGILATEQGGPGGAGGKAIELNGNILTFTTSDEATLRLEDRIKGVIS